MSLSEKIHRAIAAILVWWCTLASAGAANLTTVSAKGPADTEPKEIGHEMPQSVYEAPVRIFGSAWMITLLPEGYTLLETSADGSVVLLKDPNTNKVYRWLAGNLELLGDYDAKLNNLGVAAITKYGVFRAHYYDEFYLEYYSAMVKVWRQTDQSFGAAHIPSRVSVFHPPRNNGETPAYTEHYQWAELIQIDDQNRLWVHTFDELGKPTINSVTPPNDMRVEYEGGYATVSRGGHSFFTDGIQNYVNGTPVDYGPYWINDHGVLLAYDSGNAFVGYSGNQFVLHPDGRKEVIPHHPLFPSEPIAYSLWIDNLDRLNGFDVYWGEPVLLLKKMDQNGQPLEPLEYDIVDYEPLPIPAESGWTTDHKVAPGATAPQLGYAVETSAGTIRPFVATRNLLQLAVDANRDGVIRLASKDGSDATSVAKPFRYWINDDNDMDSELGSNESNGNDIPGQLQNSLASSVESRGVGADCSTSAGGTGIVDGVRDLVDFFPVQLDLQHFLSVLPETTAGLTFKLRQENGALNFVYTNKTSAQAFDFQFQFSSIGYGDLFSEQPGDANTHRITAEGYLLSLAFLAGIRERDRGIILVEGRHETNSPLVLTVEKDGNTIAEAKLEIKISRVEKMYRHVNLTESVTNYNGTNLTLPALTQPTVIAEPDGWPDSETNGKYFVFVHGYNVDGQKARGWNSEVFKRMYVLGSKARFVGVNWHGATGKDYHKAVYQAFQTGDVVKSALNFTGTADVTIAAHSLGNMVVSHAIQSGGYSPNRYYMINAAVPIEAYDLGNVDEAQRTSMIEDDWKSRNARFYASNWHELFSSTPDDRRSLLSWKNRFRDVLARAYNFHSPGEDVVENATIDSAAVAIQILNHGSSFFSGKGAWTAQELVKGVNWTTSLADLFLERGQGGWDRDLAYLFTSHTSITNEQLKTRPFFDEFLEGDLINENPAIASAKASEAKVQYDLLARGLPALSYAAAANRLNALDLLPLSRNFDMEAMGRTQDQWPTEGHSGDNAGKWLHSDFKNAALPYVYKIQSATSKS